MHIYYSIIDTKHELWKYTEQHMQSNLFCLFINIRLVSLIELPITMLSNANYYFSWIWARMLQVVGKIFWKV